jgi:selenocysteine-specific elongation factor
MAKPTRALVLGTAGHIDHGKTALVRALTGVDTDRLPEEQRRGITIELGFAAWNLGGGFAASIVDMPGHEAFVRTMVAGAGGMDAVLLVVSAEEGVMPQTREHLHICQLLGLRHGVVALSKLDRLGGDLEALALAEADVRAALEALAPGLADAPIVPCSAHTGEGLPALTTAVRRVAATIPPRPQKDRPIVPIDRAFAVKGHGTVATGTLLTGRLDLSRDARLRLIPVGHHRDPRELRPRALHVRNTASEQAGAGSRVALNLGNVATEDLARGDVISSGPRVVRSQVLLALLTHLAHDEVPWRSGTTVQLCAGTAHTTARLDPLGDLSPETSDLSPGPANPDLPHRPAKPDLSHGPANPDLSHGPAPSDLSHRTDSSNLSHEPASAPRPLVPPGASALVRLRLDAPLPLWHGQRLIIRSARDGAAAHRHGHTTGGGIVLDPEPSTGRGQRPRWLGLARALALPDPAARVHALLTDAAALGLERDALERRSGVVDLDPILHELRDAGHILALGEQRWVDATVLPALAAAAAALVTRFHAEHPLLPGPGRATVVHGLPGRVAPDIAAAAIAHAVASGLVDADGDLLTRPRAGTTTAATFPPRVQAVLDLFRGAGLAPPTLRELQDQTHLGEREALDALASLQRAGALVRVSPELSLAREHHEVLLTQARELLRSHGQLDVQALKNRTGLSRKFVVPFLEHLDRLQISRRQGDLRVPGPRL